MLKRNLNQMKISTFIPKVCLLLLATIGFFIFKDYGVSTDEQQSRLVGTVSLNYIANLFKIPFLLNGSEPLQNPTDVFLNFKDRDYGVAFELPAELLIKIFHIETSANAYYFRHALTFLVFLGGVIAIYSLGKKRFSSWQWGLLASSFLVFSPRIFGDAFFNDKDLVFMSLFAIGINTMINFINNPSFKTAAIHALACAIAIDSRIMASIIPIATLVVMGFEVIKDKNLTKKYIIQILFFLLSLFTFIYVSWPWLWANPIDNFLQAFKNMSRFRWSGYMFFMGEIINGFDVPWYYIPVWLTVTTPVLYLILFIVGIFATIKTSLNNGFKIWINSSQRQDVIMLGFFLAPLIAVIALHSILYNGWRHLYFIYPPFILISTQGIFYLWNLQKSRIHLRKIIFFSTALTLTWIGSWMIRNHPYQYLYFNILAKNWVRNFDVDYWGVAYKRPLEKILKHHPDQKVIIFNKMQGLAWGYWQIPYWENTFLLSESDQLRIDGTKSEQCSDFVITSLAGNALQYSQRKDFSLFDEIKVDGKLIYATYRRNEPISNISPILDSPILFSNNATQCFLQKGWIQNSEDWGVWSIGNEAILELPIPSGSNQFELNMRAFVTPKNSSQNILVSLDSGSPASFSLKKFDNNQIILPIPKTSKETGVLRIKIELSNAVTPKSLGINDDDRKLGIGLVSGTFRK